MLQQWRWYCPSGQYSPKFIVTVTVTMTVDVVLISESESVLTGIHEKEPTGHILIRLTSHDYRQYSPDQCARVYSCSNNEQSITYMIHMMLYEYMLEYTVKAIINRQSMKCMMHMILDVCDIAYMVNMTVLMCYVLLCVLL